jgi:hypothetical protein
MVWAWGALCSWKKGDAVFMGGVVGEDGEGTEPLTFPLPEQNIKYLFEILFQR